MMRSARFFLKVISCFLFATALITIGLLSVASAATLDNGGYVSGVISVAGDEDTYTFGDNDIDGEDLYEFVGDYINMNSPYADKNADGAVDEDDVAKFAQEYGKY